MSPFRLLTITGSIAFLFIACSGTVAENRFPPGSETNDGGTGDTGTTSGFNVTLDGDAATDESCKYMDLVFVIDDSGSMSQEQVNLAAIFPKFIDVINTFKTKDGTEIDYRIAVTTTDVLGNTADGKFRTTTGMSRAWLERSDKNVASTFATIANVGTRGSSTERPLEGSRQALTTRLKDSNAGFLRTDALLGIVYLTDEDDSSSGTVDSYVSTFDTLKGGRSRWATAIIAGDKPTCTSAFGSAVEAKRLKDFAAKVGTDAVFSSICSGDLAKALSDALSTFDVACKNFKPPQ